MFYESHEEKEEKETGNQRELVIITYFSWGDLIDAP